MPGLQKDHTLYLLCCSRQLNTLMFSRDFHKKIKSSKKNMRKYQKKKYNSEITCKLQKMSNPGKQKKGLKNCKNSRSSDDFGNTDQKQRDWKYN